MSSPVEQRLRGRTHRALEVDAAVIVEPRVLDGDRRRPSRPGRSRSSRPRRGSGRRTIASLERLPRRSSRRCCSSRPARRSRGSPAGSRTSRSSRSPRSRRSRSPASGGGDEHGCHGTHRNEGEERTRCAEECPVVVSHGERLWAGGGAAGRYRAKCDFRHSPIRRFPSLWARFRLARFYRALSRISSSMSASLRVLSDCFLARAAARLRSAGSSMLTARNS